MKWKRFLAGFLAGTLVVTGVPFSNLTGISAQAAAQTEQDMGLQYKYRPVDERKLSVTSNLSGSEENASTPVSGLKVKSKYMFTNELSSAEGKKLYFTLETSKLLGSVSYLPIGEDGSIERCKIYVSNVDTGDVQSIDESGWLQVYETPADDKWTSDGWQEAVFDMAQKARHVCVEVQETAGSSTERENKFISGSRMYINEAGRLSQKAESVNVALGASAGGKTTVKAYTGRMNNDTSPLNTINGHGNTEAGTADNDYWQPRSTPTWNNGNGKVNYIVYDLHSTETKISEIQLRWNARGWGSRYAIETSDTCTSTLGENSTGVSWAELDYAGKEGSTWTTVAEFDRQVYSDTAANPIRQPLDVFNDSDNVNRKLRTTTLKRYVRLVVKSVNTASDSGMAEGGLREFEIHGDVWKPQGEENVALGISAGGSTRIAAYSGADAYKDGEDTITLAPEYAIDGKVETTAGDVEHWVPSVFDAENQKGINMLNNTRDAANFVLDLGEDTTTLVSSIKVKWFAFDSANNYMVYTSDEYEEPDGVPENENNIELAGGEPVFPGTWEVVGNATDTNTGGQSFKELSIPEENYTTKRLKRYVRFEFKERASNADEMNPNIGISEIEIMGTRIAEETGDIGLSVKEPTYNETAGNSRISAAIDGNYNVENYKWYKKNGNTKTDMTADEKFRDNVTYGFEATLSTTNRFAEVMTVILNGDSQLQAYPIGDVQGPDENGKSYLTVYYEYDPLNSPIDAYNALKAEVQTSGRAQEMNRIASLAKDQAEAQYSKRSWKTFKEVYEEAVDAVGAYGSSDPSGTVEVAYESEEYYKELLADLRAEYEYKGYVGLKPADVGTADLSNDEFNPKVYIDRTFDEQKVWMEDTGGITGTTDNPDVQFIYEEGFKVNKDGSVQGMVTANNTDADGSTINQIFDMGHESANSDTKSFLIRCELGLPATVTGKQSIIGKLNSQYGIQLEPSGSAVNLQVFGCAWNPSDANGKLWPTTTIDVKEFLGQNIEMVAVYTGGKFELYAGGKRGTARAVSGNLKPGEHTPEFPKFTIGYNAEMWEHGDDSTPAKTSKEIYTGTIKNFEMYSYTRSGEEGDSAFLGNYTAPEASVDTAAEVKEFFDNYLRGHEPNVVLSGNPSAYKLKSCTWLENTEGSTTEVEMPSAYEDYRLKVEVETGEKQLAKDTDKDIVFPANAAENNFLYIKNPSTGAGAEEWITVSEDDIESCELDDTGAVLTYIYKCKGLEEPKTALAEYVKENPRKSAYKQVENESGELKDTDELRYTRQTWQAYRAAYDRAQALVQSKANRKPDIYASAKENLVTADGNLQDRSENTCECAIGAISYTGPSEIVLESGAESATVVMDDKVVVRTNRYGCLKHSVDPMLVREYGLGTGAQNTAGASIIDGDGGQKTLRVTNPGQIVLVVSATFGDASTEGKQLVIKVVSKEAQEKAKAEAQAAIERAGAIMSRGNVPLESGGTKYTAESWVEFRRQYDIANAAASPGLDNLSVEEIQKVREFFNAAMSCLETTMATEAANAAREALNNAEAVNGGRYTEASWAGYEAIKAALRAELAKEELDEAELIRLTKLLKEYKFDEAPAIVPPSEELSKAKAAAQAALSKAETSNNGRYTAESWNAYEAIKKALQAELAKEAPSVAELTRLTQQLVTYRFTAVTPDPGPGPVPNRPVSDMVTISGIQYKIDNAKSKTAAAIKGDAKLKSITVKSTVKINGTTYKVTKIGNNAFKSCKNATKLTVGANVKSIGKQAFMGCKKLKKVTFQGKKAPTIGKKAFSKTAKKVAVTVKKIKKKAQKKKLLTNLKKKGGMSKKSTIK
ncbi:leucine-rich repeat domain-containing protein [Lachnospiraceae bacterium 46-15]